MIPNWRRPYLEDAAARLPEPQAPTQLAQLHEELQRHSYLTLQLAWEEYRQVHPDGYAYSRFCELYQRWRQQLDVVLRRIMPGEKLFVDYAGATIPIHNPTGEPEHRPRSSWPSEGPATTHTPKPPRARRWSTGSALTSVPSNSWVVARSLVIPDNTRTGVNRACRYEPDLNRTYHELAMHYGVGVLPTRPYKPRDKAKVETGVQIVERWIVAALRHQKFFSLGELNRAIASYSINSISGRFASAQAAGPASFKNWTGRRWDRCRGNALKLQQAGQRAEKSTIGCRHRTA